MSVFSVGNGRFPRIHHSNAPPAVIKKTGSSNQNGVSLLTIGLTCEVAGATKGCSPNAEVVALGEGVAGIVLALGEGLTAGCDPFAAIATASAVLPCSIAFCPGGARVKPRKSTVVKLGFFL